MPRSPVVTAESSPLVTIDGSPIVIGTDGSPSSSTLDFGFEVGAGGGSDASCDLRGSVICSYGIEGSDPGDRVASTGYLRFNLDNSEKNSAETVGYYSPFHPNKASGFDFNIPISFWLQFGSNLRYKHRGKLADIVPVPGKYGERIVKCQSLDWMDDAARIDTPDLAAVTSKRADELLTTLMAALDTPPDDTDFDTGISTFAYAFDGGTGQRQKVREELNKIAMSEQGYIYIKGDATQGGTLKFEARGARTANVTTALTFNEDMMRDGLIVVGGRDEVYRTVQVVVHPTTVDASATTVLFALDDTNTLVKAGETLTTLFGPYRNPDTNEICGGTAMVSPAATTDYTMNSQADGLGTDLTANFTVTASYTGQGVRYTAITNGGGTDGYITKLQARGKGVYRSDVVVEKTVTGSYGDRVLRLDLPYQTSVNTANKIATNLTTLLSTPAARVRSVKFCANRSDDFMNAAILREPGDRIAITETVTGLNADLFVINRVTLELDQNGVLWCQWDLVPWGLDAWWDTSGFEATGGTITESGGYTYHTFTSNGTFEVTSGDATTCEYVVVGGGGGGGGDDLNSSGGGGGGGGQVQSSSALFAVGTYAVTVGAGGAGGAAHGSAGSSSTFNSLTSAGGSGGGGGGTDGNGGTIGGGGGADDSTYVGDGGDGSLYDGGTGGSNGGGGGGGAGGNGSSAPGFNIGGNGGPGVTWAGVGYGGGGSGGAYTTPGTASSGGGTGATFAGTGGAGTANRGGGGGGGRFGDGGAGGSGVVIVRYPTPD